MPIHKLIRAFLLIFSCAVSTAAYAIDYTWVGGNAARPQDWNVAENWQPQGIPGAVDKAIVGGGQTVNVPSDTVVGGLSLDTASTLQGSGAVTVNQSMVR